MPEPEFTGDGDVQFILSVLHIMSALLTFNCTLDATPVIVADDVTCAPGVALLYEVTVNASGSISAPVDTLNDLVLSPTVTVQVLVTLLVEDAVIRADNCRVPDADVVIFLDNVE